MTKKWGLIMGHWIPLSGAPFFRIRFGFSSLSYEPFDSSGLELPDESSDRFGFPKI
jgi:hypothetical protein